ncbi:MAG TPA: hypothetical protein VFC23_12805 [Thermoanaerobaculia bacterium]|nr:hypothetical protein [Thermoanaerobaculia bacterium]
MKLTSSLVLLCAIASFPGRALEPQAPSILESKVERHEGPPLWISAAAIASKDKVIDLDLVDSSTLRGYVEKQQRELGDHLSTEQSKLGGKTPSITTIPLSECKRMQDRKDDRGGAGSSETLSALAASSKTIFRGKVRTTDPGFDGGVPASLLGIEVSDVIKGSTPRSLVYVVYPVAHFKIGFYYFCNATKGFEPSSGTEVLLFDAVGPEDRDNMTYAPRMDQLFFQDRSGTLNLPPRLKNTPDLQTVRSLDDVVSRLATPAASSDHQ